MVWYSHLFQNFPQFIVIHTVKDFGIVIIRGMQIKMTMRYHLTPVRMGVIKKSKTINAGEGVEKMEHSCTVGGNVN